MTARATLKNVFEIDMFIYKILLKVKVKNMKKLLLVLPLIALLGACTETEEPLPETTPAPSVELKSVKLTTANSGLTNDDAVAPVQTSLDIEGKTEKYTVEFSAGCYIHKDYPEFVLKNSTYLKSVSTFKVDRLVIDYMSKKGITFDVKDASNASVTSHESTVATEHSNDGDYGAVLEYPINGTSWSLYNTFDGKAGTNIYSVTVIFEMAK